VDEDDTGYIAINAHALRVATDYGALVKALRNGLVEAIKELEMMRASHPACGDLADRLAERVDYPERFVNETVARR
jgi:hypothetical protein